MLDKKQFSYSSSKWVIKQWRQLTTSTHLAQKLLTHIQRNGGSRRFAMRAFKMSAVASRQKLTTTHWEHHQNWSFYDYVRSCWRTQHGPMVTLHLKQIGKGKKLSKWVPHELTTNQKNCRFEVLSSLILHNNKPFLNQTVTGNKKWIVYNNLRRPAQWLGQEAAPEHSTKPKLHQKKVTVTVWWSAAHLIDTAFWMPAKPLQWRSMPGKPMRWTENGNTCSRHWSTERAQFFMMTPDCRSHNQYFKSWTNWATKFCLIHHIHLTSRQPTTSFSSILTTFCRENTFTSTSRQKMLSRSLLNPEAWIFMLQE